MKKNVLALSIAVGLLGLAGGAHAVTDPGIAAVAGSKLTNNVDGIGHILLVPYFTSQAANSTLINIVNTDTVNAKAVKVRFRGAANSDDIFDFQVFLSPADVWAASISRGADGRSILTTADSSCTKPNKATLNSTPFVTARLDSALTGDALAAQTREGYVEILNMADITPTVGGVTNSLFTAVKHVANGVPPCDTAAAFTALDVTTDKATAAWNTAGLQAPTTGLMANWTIINTVGASSWSGTADTVEARDTITNLPVAGNMVYWPQTSTPVVALTANSYTADPLIRTDGQTPAGGATTAASAPAFSAGFYDFPDLSTPYTAAAGVPGAFAPLRQALSQTQAIAAVSVTNEYLTTTTIAATTDWTFSMPTRRYSVAMNYAALTAGTEGRRFSELVDDGATNTLTTGFFTAGNTVVSNRQICVTGITQIVYDREENSPTSSVGVVVSPSSPGVPTSFCGEASVLSFNNGAPTAAGTGSLRATVATKDITVPYADGWMAMTTPAASGVAGVVPGGGAAVTPRGLPLLGQAFVRAVGGTGGQTFGASWGHRLGR